MYRDSYGDEAEFEMALRILEEHNNDPVIKLYREAWDESGRNMQELYGDSDGSDLPASENAIIWDDTLTHEQKVSKLRVMRGDKTQPVKLSKDDRAYLKQMGIRL